METEPEKGWKEAKPNELDKFKFEGLPPEPVADRVLDIMNKSMVSPEDAALTAGLATAEIIIWRGIQAIGTAAFNTAGGFLMIPKDFEQRFMQGGGSCSIENNDAVYCMKGDDEIIVEKDSDNRALISDDGKIFVLECFETKDADKLACKVTPVNG